MDKLKVNINGKRINNFINRLLNLKIELYDVEYISKEEINIIIDKKDYEKIRKNKTIYTIKIIDKIGVIKIKEFIKNNLHLIFFFIIGLIILLILSNIIFDIKVIHNDKQLRELLINELKNNNVDKYRFKKSRNEIEDIKDIILKKYKDKIEWLERSRNYLYS